MAESAAPKSQGSQTNAIPFTLWLDPAYIDYFRTGLLVFVFLLSMWARNRRTWILIDMVAVFIFGLAFLFIPGTVMAFQVDRKFELGSVLMMVCRTFGSVMIGSSIAWFFLRKSTDNYTQVMLLATRLVGNASLLIATFVARAESKIFNDQFVQFSIVGVSLWTFGSGLYFLSAKNYGGHTQLDSWLNLHLRIDFFLTLMFALMWYSFPRLVLVMHGAAGKITDVHMLVTQAIGAMMIGSSILSAVAPGFMFQEDKRNVLLSRILTIILIAVTSLSSFDPADISKSAMLGHLIGVAWIINAGLGYLAPHETDGYWSSRKKANKKE